MLSEKAYHLTKNMEIVSLKTRFLRLFYSVISGFLQMDFLVTNISSIYKKYFHRHESTQNNTLHFENKLLPFSGETPNCEKQLA